MEIARELIQSVCGGSAIERQTLLGWQPLRATWLLSVMRLGFRSTTRWRFAACDIYIYGNYSCWRAFLSLCVDYKLNVLHSDCCWIFVVCLQFQCEIYMYTYTSMEDCVYGLSRPVKFIIYRVQQSDTSSEVYIYFFLAPVIHVKRMIYLLFFSSKFRYDRLFPSQMSYIFYDIVLWWLAKIKYRWFEKKKSLFFIFKEARKCRRNKACGSCIIYTNVYSKANWQKNIALEKEKDLIKRGMKYCGIEKSESVWRLSCIYTFNKALSCVHWLVFHRISSSLGREI